MEILNTTETPTSPTKLYEVVCQTCSADIRFTRSEALSEESNRTSTILTINCPVCENPVKKTLNNKIEEQVVTVEDYNNLPL